MKAGVPHDRKKRGKRGSKERDADGIDSVKRLENPTTTYRGGLFLLLEARNKERRELRHIGGGGGGEVKVQD